MYFDDAIASPSGSAGNPKQEVTLFMGKWGTVTDNLDMQLHDLQRADQLFLAGFNDCARNFAEDVLPLLQKSGLVPWDVKKSDNRGRQQGNTSRNRSIEIFPQSPDGSPIGEPWERRLSNERKLLRDLFQPLAGQKFDFRKGGPFHNRAFCENDMFRNHFINDVVVLRPAPPYTIDTFSCPTTEELLDGKN